MIFTQFQKIMKTEISRIRIDGDHWNKIIALPCFQMLYKTPDGELCLSIDACSPSFVGAPGDWIVEYDDGTYDIDECTELEEGGEG